MDNKTVLARLKTPIIQPNIMTNAYYDYTALQKNILYFIVSALQKYMTKEKPASIDLWGNMTVTVDIKHLVQTSNHTEVHKAIEGLMKKPISYNYTQSNGTVTDIKTTLIYNMKHDRGSQHIDLKISAESLPILIYIGQGFTAYSKTIALSLPSVYAKRIYELCCRWRDKGYIRMRLEELRKMLGIDEYGKDGNIVKQKFKQLQEFKIDVLEKAKNILNEQADITFRYNLIKENSRAFNVIEFWIETKDEIKEKVTNQYQEVLIFLQRVYHDIRAYEVTEIIYRNGQIEKAAERFKRMQHDIESKKIKEHGIMGYVTAVLIQEYTIPEKLVVSEKTKKTKEKIKIVNEILSSEDIAHLNEEQKASMLKNTVNAIFNAPKRKNYRQRDVQPIGNVFKKVT